MWYCGNFATCIDINFNIHNIMKTKPIQKSLDKEYCSPSVEIISAKVNSPLAESLSGDGPQSYNIDVEEIW